MTFSFKRGLAALAVTFCVVSTKARDSGTIVSHPPSFLYENKNAEPESMRVTDDALAPEIPAAVPSHIPGAIVSHPTGFLQQPSARILSQQPMASQQPIASQQPMESQQAANMPIGSQFHAPIVSQPAAMMAPVHHHYSAPQSAPAAPLAHAPYAPARKTASAPPLLSFDHKPKVDDAMVHHLFEFEPPAAQVEDCEAINQELAANDGTNQAHVQFEIILASFDRRDMPPEETVQQDKIAANSIGMMYAQMVGGDDTSADLVTYMERLIKCKVQPLANGRGIIQNLIFFGMEKCLREPFIEVLFKGISGYNPSLELDTYGNNLLHLAAMSGGHNLPTLVFNMEEQKNKGHEDRNFNAPIWLMSALQHKNNDGKVVLELITTPLTRARVKGFFRAYTTYIKLQIKKDEKLASLSKPLEKVSAMLKSAPVLPSRM